MTFRPPVLPSRAALVDAEGNATQFFQRTWQNLLADLTRQVKIMGSGTDAATITAADVGADATVTISTHTRIYSDGTTVSVTGGTVTGLAFSTLYYIYYDQTSLDGGAVTYFATTTATDAAQVGERHLVGTVTTPADGAADTNGTVLLPPGLSGL